jgi:crotonobetainyl-CoA:carnitine CoA-transferase CaiB-like acyl-CoA transferase
MEDIFKDEHYRARGDLISVKDDDLGDITMQGVVPKLPARNHVVGHAGRSKGQDNVAVYSQLMGLGEADLRQLKDEGVV